MYSLLKSIRALVVIFTSLYLLYWLKSALGINLDILGKEHLPLLIEEASGSLIHCEWFPYKQDCHPRR
jgi:hypothetical protein